MTTWARFFWRDNAWHLAGFTSHLAAAREFEDWCAGEGLPCVVLALPHPAEETAPPVAERATGRKRRRRVTKVTTEGEML